MRKPKTGTIVLAALLVALLAGLTVQAYILYELNQRVRTALGTVLGGLSALSLESGDSALLGDSLLGAAPNGEPTSGDTRQLLDDLLSQPMDGGGSVSDQDLAAAQDLLRSLLGGEAGALDLRGLEGLEGPEGLDPLAEQATPPDTQARPAPAPAPVPKTPPAPRGSLPEVTPTADLLDQPSRYYMLLNVPGVDEDTVSVRLDGQRLVVDAVATTTLPAGERGTVLMRERQTGHYHREVTLPRDVDPATLSWRHDNGILHVTVGKA